MVSRRETVIGGIGGLLCAFSRPRHASAQSQAPAEAQSATPALDGKTALVTGSTSGLGREVALRLGALGATVIVHGRDTERGREVEAEINDHPRGDAVFYRADLASLAEVRTLARAVLDNHERLDLLINNAGIGGGAQTGRSTSADGHELTFAINYLSHFLLTRELLPLLERSAPARIVNVASAGQSPVDFDDVMLTRNFSPTRAYSQSKLAQIMFTMTLAEQLDAARVTVNSLHPATFMDTNMVRSSGRQPMTTVDEGADAVMQLAVFPALAARTGLYFNGLQEARANAQAYDAEARRRLWELSVELTEG
jgi:NAD(P)-dependent dehydrogenase (short-subunit alcohol dehydrogenase family)